ncbi:hypothetical protein IQ268_20895 [Oculatella sp. LEGE 06141]|uniref:hypothetical protein n=1 Tax=Oculatella sp. LEGE 06141 TaxID=1828648 RepID=UPI0018803E6E|nr:hypothetical protein [Oculatella sp. LEGE 06141]MBE9181021.1 hypothetical protein [Oculatella sp. LEGE 06141]
MNLPVILDVALGLVFIYLILSLLASEIQEILATLFQWRADHLKKSIEILLSGGKPKAGKQPQTAEDKAVERIVNELYDNPLIKNINQQSQKGVASYFRKLTARWVDLGEEEVVLHPLTVPPTVVKIRRRSGPSYIPAATFSTTLLVRLGIPNLIETVTWFNLARIVNEELMRDIRELISTLNQPEIEPSAYQELSVQLDQLQNRLTRILANLRCKRITLQAGIVRLKSTVETFAETCSELAFFTDYPARQQTFKQDITSILQDVCGNGDHHDELLGRVRPSLPKVMDMIQGNLAMLDRLHTEMETLATDPNSSIAAMLDEAAQDIKNQIEAIAEHFPLSVRNSLATLAVNAQITAKDVDQELNRFKREVEHWFDRSMDRASGVYKRNAKGVTFLIGLLVAAIANADTFHMVSRLSSDNTLQAAVASSASQISLSAGQIDQVKREVDRALADISLPIGWTSSTLCRQSGLVPSASQNNVLLLHQLDLQQACVPLEPEQAEAIPGGDQRIAFVLKRLPGWILSAVAIGMGAPFWFQLLNTVLNVRNTGKKPPSSTDEPLSDKST